MKKIIFLASISFLFFLLWPYLALADTVFSEQAIQVSVNPTTISQGENVTLTATITPDGSFDQDNQHISFLWSRGTPDDANDVFQGTAGFCEQANEHLGTFLHLITGATYLTNTSTTWKVDIEPGHYTIFGAFLNSPASQNEPCAPNNLHFHYDEITVTAPTDETNEPDGTGTDGTGTPETIPKPSSPKPPTDWFDDTTNPKLTTPGEVIIYNLVKIINKLLLYGGIVAFLVIIYGGILYMTAGSNQEQSQRAKKVIIGAIIGIAIIALSYAIVLFLKTDIFNSS